MWAQPIPLHTVIGNVSINGIFHIYAYISQKEPFGIILINPTENYSHACHDGIDLIAYTCKLSFTLAYQII